MRRCVCARRSGRTAQLPGERVVGEKLAAADPWSAIAERFATALDWVDTGFLAGGVLDKFAHRDSSSG